MSCCWEKDRGVNKVGLDGRINFNKWVSEIDYRFILFYLDDLFYVID